MVKVRVLAGIAALALLAFGDDAAVDLALALESTCESEDDCSLELRQLRGEAVGAAISKHTHAAEQAVENSMALDAGEADKDSEGTEDSMHDTMQVRSTDEPLMLDMAVASGIGASEQTASISAISLHERGSDIFMIWPGSGYAGVLDGGIWQAAKFDQGYNIESILASSGGASSAFLCLIDEAHGSDRSLTRYKQLYTKYASASVYGWSSTTSGCNTKPADDDACWWYYNYKQALDYTSFQNVKKKLKISLKCKRRGLVVLYNFKSQEQVAQALAAAGNGGANSFKVDSLNDWCWDHDTSVDGWGFPYEFNPQRLPIWYYNNGPGTSASGAYCPGNGGWTSILAEGYKCPGAAVQIARTKHWSNKNYLWRPGTYHSISNDFYYSTGAATWVDGR